jgi:hypothetical protein
VELLRRQKRGGADDDEDTRLEGERGREREREREYQAVKEIALLLHKKKSNKAQHHAHFDIHVPK